MGRENTSSRRICIEEVSSSSSTVIDPLSEISCDGEEEENVPAAEIHFILCEWRERGEKNQRTNVCADFLIALRMEREREEPENERLCFLSDCLANGEREKNQRKNVGNGFYQFTTLISVVSFVLAGFEKTEPWSTSALQDPPRRIGHEFGHQITSI
ncbi:hypothetical protein MRB53_028619 [Persea americana]|uniref:Uncharacterized protein n=1 Tax=Persea americana TaxID=3435 RepID=A0ACC2KG16_PERAE|nr:hypothetical protein MRB53_028619 [Persea americana]